MLPEVFRSADRARLGVSEARLRAQLDAARWQRPTSTVVVTHNGPLTPDQIWLTAVLTASAGRIPAALSAWTALQSHGLRGWPRPRVHVLVPRGSSHLDFGELPVALHESRRFTARDVRDEHAVARTSVERSAIDAAAWSPSPRAACGVLAACVQQRLTSATRLRAELLTAGRIRHRRLLLAVLVDIEGGAQAVSELDFLAFCRRHRLPRPEQQQVRRDGAGRRRYLDATFRAASGAQVHVEIDGALHLAVETYWSDMQRGNDLVLVGATALRFPSFAVHADDPAMVRQLDRALAG